VGNQNLVANTLVATTVAITQEADYLELPVNMSADNQLIVSRGIQLDKQTDVAELFADRQREDGSYYTVDFTISELRQLRKHNTLTTDEPVFSLGIASLREELVLIKKLNTLLHKNTGVVIDIQDPQFYRTEGKEISLAILQELVTSGFLPGDKIYLQSSDPDELQKISNWSQLEKQEKYALIQRFEAAVDKNSDQTELEMQSDSFHNWLFTNSGVRILASYATAIALPAEMLAEGSEETTQYLKSLHNYGIQIFALDNAVENTFSQTLETGEATHQKNLPAGAGTIPDGMYTKTLVLQKPVSFDATPTAAETKEEHVMADREDNVNTADNTGGVDGVDGAVQTTDRKNTTTLPPFFSNLGLQPPQNHENVPGSQEENKTTDTVNE
jgi:glycerophosphoryl diester phosphodiesterase